jgi:hypothetical protein
MKIAFVAGELEPGRNGVGDYTRLLAGECARLGHDVSLLALADRFVDRPTLTGGSAADPCPRELRLPQSSSWESRATSAAWFVDGAEWVSLQFVCYAFQRKGIVRGLADHLRPAVRGRRLQVMMHELWIGAELGSPLKHRIVGAIQRHVIGSLLRRLAPEIVHTSNDAYAARLSRIGVLSHTLPLFGNIPVTDRSGDHWLFPLLRSSGVEIRTFNRNRYWLFGMFGALQLKWSPDPLFSVLQSAARKAGRSLVVLAAGDMGAGSRVWESLPAQYPSIRFLNLGCRPGERISEYLNSLDAGIATTSYSRIGKSGSAAAMLDHGLPVIVSRDDDRYRNIAVPSYGEEQIYMLDERLIGRLAAGLHRRPPESAAPGVARRFLHDLNCAARKDARAGRPETTGATADAPS